MFLKIFFALAALSIAVNAQGSSSSTAPTGTPSVSPCILGCVLPAAAQNGCAPTDVSCLCTNAQFQVDALGCLTQNCPTEVQAATALQQAQCAALSLTPTATATPRPVSFTSLGGASSTSPVSSGSSASRPSSTASAGATGAGTILHAGVLPYFGAVLAGVLAL